jgi:hypothetical protein
MDISVENKAREAAKIRVEIAKAPPAPRQRIMTIESIKEIVWTDKYGNRFYLDEQHPGEYILRRMPQQASG